MSSEPYGPHHPGSNALPVSPAENARILTGMIAMGLGRFRVMSEHEHRLEWERKYRQR